jgi:hypothetical protein
MRTVKLLLVVGLIILVNPVFAQDYTFKVMVNKGANEVKSANSWQPVKTGASLRSDDELKLASNAYIGLIHVSGKPYELKEAGSYKVSELAAKVTGGSSALNKYTDFILSSNDEKKHKLGATGAVHRGSAESSDIQIMLPENQNSEVFNSVVVINWTSKSSGPFVVDVRNLFEEPLGKIETSETSVKIDLKDPKYAKETGIFVVVSLKSDPKQVSKQHFIKKISSSDGEKVKKLLSDIMGDVAEQTALNNFFLAGFYESQGLLIDAIGAYEDAVRLEPSYQEDYDNFLIRNGLKRD